MSRTGTKLTRSALFFTLSSHGELVNYQPHRLLYRLRIAKLCVGAETGGRHTAGRKEQSFHARKPGSPTSRFPHFMS